LLLAIGECLPARRNQLLQNLQADVLGKSQLVQKTKVQGPHEKIVAPSIGERLIAPKCPVLSSMHPDVLLTASKSVVPFAAMNSTIALAIA
jgi:hypothetical protein